MISNAAGSMAVMLEPLRLAIFLRKLVAPFIQMRF